eukprot:s217_g18.t1
MPTPSVGGREPPVDKVARDPRTSTTSDSDFYTTFCRMYELTPTTSEVPSVWDAGSGFTFHPPPPPPPPPRHRRSSTVWDISAAVPKERPENGCEVHWSNPYGPDPPAEVAPPAAKPVIEDAFQKADKPSTFSSSFREEGLAEAPKEASEMSDPCSSTPPMEEPAFAALANLSSSFREEGLAEAPKEASEMSDPCSSTPPMEEPAFAALANLRVSAEMPGGPPASFTLSDFYSMQGPLSPCSPAPTESYGGRVAPHSQELTEYDDGRQGLLSPAATAYPFDRRASFASTQVGAPWTEYNAEHGLAGGFSPKFPAGSPVKPDDLLREDYDFPVGMPPTDSSEHSFENCSPQWCGLFSSCWHESAPETCSRCKQALRSFIDHHCPKCSNAVCVNCIAKLNGQTFRCNCGDEPKIDSTLWMMGAYNFVVNAFEFITSAKPARASEGYTCGDEPKIDSTLWMMGAYNFVVNAFEFITSAKPARASEGYTAMPSRSQANLVPNPLLELPPAASTALPQHRTLCPASTKEMLPATALPPPPQQPLPSLLSHRRRVSQVVDVFKTHLPGEMPCSPICEALQSEDRSKVAAAAALLGDRLSEAAAATLRRRQRPALLLLQDLCSSPSRSIIGSGLRDSRLENYISLGPALEMAALDGLQLLALDGWRGPAVLAARRLNYQVQGLSPRGFGQSDAQEELIASFLPAWASVQVDGGSCNARGRLQGMQETLFSVDEKLPAVSAHHPRGAHAERQLLLCVLQHLLGCRLPESAG